MSSLSHDGNRRARVWTTIPSRCPNPSVSAGICRYLGQDQRDDWLQPGQRIPANGQRIALTLGGVALIATIFLKAVLCLGGAAAVYHATGTDLMAATSLDALTYTAPFAAAGLLMYSLVPLRARRPLSVSAFCGNHLAYRYENGGCEGRGGRVRWRV